MFATAVNSAKMLQPPGLEHVDTAANLKALSALKLHDNARTADVDVAISIIPPTARVDGTFDGQTEINGELLHTEGKYALSPAQKIRELDEEDDYSLLAIVHLPDHLLKQSNETVFFLPPGLLDDDDEDEAMLLQKLDMAERAAHRRPCKAEHCLKGRAFELIDALQARYFYLDGDRDGGYYTPDVLFSPVRAPAHSSPCISSTSSETGSEPALVATSTDSYTSRSPSPDSSRSLADSTGTSARDSDGNTLTHRHDDSVYFHSSEFKGVPLSDIKALKSDSLVQSEDEVLTSWGARGCPSWIRLVVNQHGYHKKSFFIPTRCYCSSITRAKLAYDIASLLQLYFATGLIRRGFAEDPKRRNDVEGLYLHSLRRNALDRENMVWRASVSDSAVSWTGKSKAR